MGTFGLAAGQGLLENRLVKLPGTVGIGRRMRGGFRALHDTEVAESALQGGQAAADLAQALGMGELAEKHRDELLAASETTGVTFGLVLTHEGLELETGEGLSKLAENAGYSIHGGGLPCGRSQFHVGKPEPTYQSGCTAALLLLTPVAESYLHGSEVEVNPGRRKHRPARTLSEIFPAHIQFADLAL